MNEFLTSMSWLVPAVALAAIVLPAMFRILREYERGGIELAIKAHYRQGDDILPTYVDKDGTVHIEVPAGHQIQDPDHNVPVDHPNRARWNFTFSYNVALDSDNPDLDSYRGWLLIDTDPSHRTKFLPLRLSKLTDTPVGQKSGYGWKLGSTVAIPDDEGTSKVTQNSQNMAFYEDVIDADPYTPGQQSYAATDYGPGQFEVVLVLQGKHGKKASLHAVFDVVETE